MPSQPDALGCQPIDPRRADELLAIAAKFAIAEIVGQNEEDIRGTGVRVSLRGGLAGPYYVPKGQQHQEKQVFPYLPTAEFSQWFHTFSLQSDYRLLLPASPSSEPKGLIHLIGNTLQVCLPTTGNFGSNPAMEIDFSQCLADIGKINIAPTNRRKLILSS